MLAAVLLGGGLIPTHSHDGLTHGKIDSVAWSGGHDHHDNTEHVESATAIEFELCPACTIGRRPGVLDALQLDSRLPVMVTLGLRPVDDLLVPAAAAQPRAPRGPPAV